MSELVTDREDGVPEGEEAVLPIRADGVLPLVVLGGSGGAVSAIEAFFASLPPEPGMVFVVLLHRSEEREPELMAALKRATSMRVVRVEQSRPIEANTIHVISTAQNIRTAHNSLVVVADEAAQEHSAGLAVDEFLRRLAVSHGPRAAAVILSGDEPDGASGLKRIKEHGGLTIAQDPEEAVRGAMPRSAIHTGMVDWVLPARDIGARLQSYFELGEQLDLPDEAPGGTHATSDEAVLRNVLTLLRNRTGRDFSAYKRPTIVRRIARRMQVNGTDTLPAYLNLLRTLPGEAGALLQDLLISVTNFFRDAECFAALEEHIGSLFKDKGPGEAVRIWVPGCATGEEAYSLAMLLDEAIRTRDFAPKVQIFATDLDPDAIRTARGGFYPSAIEADVPAERLRRHFVREFAGYRIRRELRDMVLFAQHDALKDSPFSRVDLVSCRNLLIYLNRDAQEQLFQTFHFSLLPQGLLFLGASESIAETQLFTVLHKKCRIYAQQPAATATFPPVSGHSNLSLVLNARYAPALAAAAARRPLGPPAQHGRVTPVREPRDGGWGELHLRMLEALAPPSVLVDAEYEILHMSAHAGRFMQFSGGTPSTNLLQLVHPSLRIQLRACLFEALQGRNLAEAVVAPVELGGDTVEVRMQVNPAWELGAQLLLVTFATHPVGAQEGAGGGDVPGRLAPDELVQQLDRELAQLKTNLRDIVEEYEASTEELKASNEELLAMNEELRSATEELETSREELQSINEEITTVNHELKSKVDELAHANSDMHNLMDATAMPTVFLDRDLRVLRYTPPAVTLFNLIPSDVGRPLADLATQLDYPQLSEDAVQVLARLAPIEREVGLASGTWYLTRLLPYRTMEDRIAGVVMSFVDITRRKQAEETRIWLSAVVASLNDAIISFSMDRTILSWNGGAEQIFGYSPDEAIGQRLSLLGAGWTAAQEAAFTERRRSGATESLETTVRCKDGRVLHVAVSAAPIKDQDGKVIGGTAILRDTTETRRALAALRDSEERMRLMIENASEYAIFSMDMDRLVTIWSAGAERLLGFAEKEILGKSADIIFTREDLAAGAAETEAQTARAEGRATDDRQHQRKDGSLFWASGATMLMRDADGRAVGFVKVLRDQSAVRQSQQALERSRAELTRALEENEGARRALEAADVAKDRFLAVLSHELRNPLASIASSAELLRAGRADPAAPERASQVVQRQAAAMKVLLDDLLDVSRLRLGRLELRRAEVTLATVVEMALEATRPLVEAARHKLSVTLPPEQVTLDADPLRLSQVMSNLLSNAVKYTPQGGRIDLEAILAPEGEVVITVGDNGIGMEAAEIDRMFDLFSQSPDALERASGGLGIGLALARSIIEMHGGWIRATSPGPGKGSEFKIGMRFRSVAVAPAPRPAVAPAQPPEAPSAGASQHLVLIADDNGDAAWGLAKLLELAGFRTLLASGGEEALRIARKERPTVAVLDIGMPDLSGHEVARRLRAATWGRGMVLIAATGWGQEADQQKSHEAGFDEHLTKPLNVRKLKDVINQHLSKSPRDG
jgi:two-component system CheB/CheR fusion protein